MRLIDLNPKQEVDQGIRGMSFDCPKCHSLNGARISIPFEGKVAWQTQNENDFEHLTFTPSIAFTHHIGKPESCHAHFFVTNGEIILLPS